MTVEIDIEVGKRPVQAIPVPVTTGTYLALSGEGRLCGWALRDASGSIPSEHEGSQTSPIAATVIVTITGLPAGTYDVNWLLQLGGTPAAADANNFGLLQNATLLTVSVNEGAVGDYPQASRQINVNQGDSISIEAVAAGTAGAIYTAQLSLEPADVPSCIGQIDDVGNPLGEFAPLPNGTDVQDFGSEGIKIRGQILVSVQRGAATGVIYASFDR